MLEEAANMSVASQLSIFNSDLPSKPASSSLPTVMPALAQVKYSSPGRSSSCNSQQETLLPKSVESQKSELAPHLEAAEDDSDDYDEVDDSDSVDLNETLKFSPSLARGVEFNDREAWDSFNHGSPHSRCRSESSGSDRTIPHASPSSQGGARRMRASPPKAIWKSPVKKEVLSGCRSQEEGGWRLGRRSWEDKVGGFGGDGTNQTPKPSGAFGSSHSSLTQGSSHQSSDSHLSENFPGSSRESLPPPSALVSKLFPALKRAEEPKKLIPNHPMKLHQVSDGHAPFTKSPSPESSIEGDSGIRSLSSTSVALSEDLKYKLNQLEEEIAKYREENANLEKLRREREEVSLKLLGGGAIHV